MTGTGLVYGSLWDDSERGGCQDFIRPLKRAQQMPWHVRSTDAWPHARRRPLSLSLSLLHGDRGSRPSHRFKFAFPPRVHRASREVVSDIAPRTPRWPLCRATCLFAPKEHVLPPPSLLCGRYTVGRAPLLSNRRTDGRESGNLETESWSKKLERPSRIGEEISSLEE